MIIIIIIIIIIVIIIIKMEHSFQTKQKNIFSSNKTFKKC